MIPSTSSEPSNYEYKFTVEFMVDFGPTNLSDDPLWKSAFLQRLKNYFSEKIQFYNIDLSGGSGKCRPPCNPKHFVMPDFLKKSSGVLSYTSYVGLFGIKNIIVETYFEDLPATLEMEYASVYSNVVDMEEYIYCNPQFPCADGVDNAFFYQWCRRFAHGRKHCGL